MISMHSGGGSPEVALFNGGANYNDMVGEANEGTLSTPHSTYSGQTGILRIFVAENDHAVIGTSITAVEIAKLPMRLMYDKTYRSERGTHCHGWLILWRILRSGNPGHRYSH